MSQMLTPSSPPLYRPPAEGALPLVYQDASLLVLDKPAGLLSVPGRGEDKADCLISRARRYFPEALTVHRLDMETSGLILLARSPAIQRALSILFESRQVEKRYVAVVSGSVAADQGEITLPLITDWPNRPRQMVCHEHGKPSHTRFAVLERSMAHTRIALEPLTGRSHQLRVHMLAIGHAILGDSLYGTAEQRAAAPRLLLHAEALGFPHPVSAEPCRFLAPSPF